mmetsp:Transcript_17252/g.19969  ORF Transcript_17252/g.19969 Transcript_17252/m.19969 type:complete len:83 (-) Transcript_17252:42-290(-)
MISLPSIDLQQMAIDHISQRGSSRLYNSFVATPNHHDESVPSQPFSANVSFSKDSFCLPKLRKISYKIDTRTRASLAMSDMI